MSEIRKLPAQAERVESGSIQFGDDWPGVFLRGDDCAGYAICLKMKLDGYSDVINDAVVRGLLKTLQSCIIGPAGEEMRR